MASNPYYQFIEDVEALGLEPSNRVVFKCSNCGEVRVHEYIVREGYVDTRITPTGLHTVEYDTRCTECNSYRVKVNAVKGYVNKHLCDERCLMAENHTCHCSCGGKNHGKGRVV